MPSTRSLRHPVLLLGIAALAATLATGCGPASPTPATTHTAGGLASTATGAAPQSAGPPAAPTTNPRTSVVSGVHVVAARSHVVDDMHLAAGRCHVRVLDAATGKVLPDPACTPGAVDPGVTEANLSQTICRSGFSSSVRAPTSETTAAKKQSLLQYGQPSTRTTEYDHLLSLEIGGTNATSNLWPEPNSTDAKGVNNPKDKVENQLHAAICSHKISLGDAQKAMATDWTTAVQAIH